MTAGRPGDADRDGDADGRDFLVWQQQVGQLPDEGSGWHVVGGVSDHYLAERFLHGGTTLAPNQQLDLGAPFRPGGAQDLAFRFGVSSETGLIVGPVQYVTSGPATAVPEPAMSLGAILVGAIAIAARHRRVCAQQHGELASAKR